ncbi:hypothetical protein DEU38_12121 [Rhodococcus sp. AG1013]|nr:hypothetical protein DEU38_12121 [Rhodococcus sp. AG1013]
MLCFGLRCVSADSRLVRSAIEIARPALAGSIIALRPVLRGLQAGDDRPRRMAIVALDSGAWCFGWIIGGLSSKGARVRSLARMPGEKYPTFTLAAPDDEGPSSSTS